MIEFDLHAKVYSENRTPAKVHQCPVHARRLFPNDPAAFYANVDHTR